MVEPRLKTKFKASYTRIPLYVAVFRDNGDTWRIHTDKTPNAAAVAQAIAANWPDRTTSISIRELGGKGRELYVINLEKGRVTWALTLWSTTRRFP